MKKVTIVDIAKLAGTSTATVSRVLNKSNYPVKPYLKDKVLKIAEELNYSPNLVGKQLKTNKSNEIGVVIPNISNIYYSQLISGLEHILQENNFFILLCNTNGNADLEKKYLEYLYQKQVKGLIISSVGQDIDYLKFLQNNGMEIVSFEQDLDLNCAKINFDYFRGGYIAAKKFIEDGHRKIGFISAPLTRHSRIEIYNGFTACLKDYNIPKNNSYFKIGVLENEYSGGTFEYKNGKNLAKELLNEEVLPTALFCVNDMTAFGVMQQLQLSGFEIPADISIIGFDNVDISEIVNPSLTTIDQSTFEMGRLSANALMGLLQGETKNLYNILLQPLLVERNSTTNVSTNIFE